MIEDASQGAATTGTPIVPPSPLTAEDERLVAALRRGDETAFTDLVSRLHPAMVRAAQTYVGNAAVAEEVAQETWIGVLTGIDRFAGRSSLRTWIFGILTNQAKTRGVREARCTPFSALSRAHPDDEVETPTVDPDCFFPHGHEWAGHWQAPPRPWQVEPEAHLLAGETHHELASTIARLPPNQRRVIVLRDVEGWTAPEVCDLLAISEANQRVLLHRARCKVRQSLETHLAAS